MSSYNWFQLSYILLYYTHSNLFLTYTLYEGLAFFQATTYYNETLTINWTRRSRRVYIILFFHSLTIRRFLPVYSTHKQVDSISTTYVHWTQLFLHTYFLWSYHFFTDHCVLILGSSSSNSSSSSRKKEVNGVQRNLFFLLRLSFLVFLFLLLSHTHSRSPGLLLLLLVRLVLE